MNLHLPITHSNNLNNDERLILVIDQDLEFVTAMKEIFERNQISVLVATTATKGIDLFHSANPDLVLIDADLTDRDGFQVLSDIAEIAQGRVTPIAITSWEKIKERTILAYQMGATDFS
jgi:DNA-binding response OmpR family regulator